MNPVPPLSLHKILCEHGEACKKHVEEQTHHDRIVGGGIHDYGDENQRRDRPIYIGTSTIDNRSDPGAIAKR